MNKKFSKYPKYLVQTPEIENEGRVSFVVHVNETSLEKDASPIIS